MSHYFNMINDTFTLMSLFDSHGRQINYLRLAITDGCNLRCHYCMPSEDMLFMHKSEWFTRKEYRRLMPIWYDLGIRKIRLTGGEPLIRKDILGIIDDINQFEGVKISITTNGVLLENKIEQFIDRGINSFNISLDSVDSTSYFQITKRDQYDKVEGSIYKAISLGCKIKINMVVIRNVNDQQIGPMLDWAKKFPVEVRFLEQMPFDGRKDQVQKTFDHLEIQNELKSWLPKMSYLGYGENGGTVELYSDDSLIGKVGIIAAYSRTFCGTCNRLRLTSEGNLRSCLYSAESFNLKDMMRNGATDEMLGDAILEVVKHKAVDGFESEKNYKSSQIFKSMTTIGG